MAIEVIRRTETKFLLDRKTYEELLKKISPHIEKDEYFESFIYNIYYDTDNFDLIIKSIEKPVYKEKVRLRSYGIPKLDDYVFLEIKKKYSGVVGKRRVRIKLRDFYDYIENGTYPKCNQQIMKEIDYCFKIYNLKPKMFLAYDRHSYYDKDNKNFRITFDWNIRSREENLKLNTKDAGDKPYLDENYLLMETKAMGSLPMWFTSILSSLKIYPTSFSKYGNIYKKKVEGKRYE